MNKRIVMIGSARNAHSGISAVVNVYVAEGLFRRWHVCYIATQSDGSKPYKAGMAAAAWLRFMWLLVTNQVALLHVLAASDASFWRKTLFILPAHLFGVPYVMHLHCGRFVEFYEKRCGAWGQWLVRWVYGRASRVLALSDAWREELAPLVPGMRLTVLPNPVAIPSWQARLGAAPPTVLFLGMLREWKGWRDLLRAWPVVRRAVPDARLVLAGTGQLDAAREVAERLGVLDSVEMPGWVVGDAKKALLSQAWVVSLPSYSEALPMTVLEAMAAGVPVVATRIAAIPWALDEGRVGLLIEPGDVSALAQSLITLLKDSGKRRQIGAAGRARAIEAFSAPVLIGQLESLWRRLAPQSERVQPPIASRRADVPRTS